MSDSEFINIFLDEAAEVLDRWEAVVLKIESDPSAENLNDLFRSAHNLKGSSRSVGLEAFGAFVHQVEDLITQLKTGETKVTPEVVSVLLDSQMMLVRWIGSLRQSSSEVIDCTAILQRIEVLRRPVAATSASMAFGFFDDEPPAVTQPAAPLKDLGTILVESGAATQLQIEDAVRQQHKKLGEILVDRGVASPEAVQDALAKQRSQGQKPDDTIRVSLRKLDTLFRLVGELSIQHSIVRSAKESNELGSARTNEAIELAHKAIQDLQTEAMGLRMQPLENLFQRMERVCRDVARTQSKNIRVEVIGADVELDKTVIERMKDPLIHILRNAVDHGIETAEARGATSKPPVATVSIEGRQTASNVTIIIRDDGRGLNVDKIFKKAVERGLIDAGAKLSPAEMNNLIFLPGLSTAEKVTDVSGRGVGMDVVKKAVDDLGGEVLIHTKVGAGTEFHIILPSTLSILDAVVVSLNDSLYAVPLQDIEEVVALADNHIETSANAGRLINLRGRVMPLERLSSFLPTKQRTDAATDGVALVAAVNGRTLVLEVDRIVGQQQIVVRPLEEKLANVPGYTGATILSTGEPSMIVHLPHVIKSYMAGLNQ